LQTSAAHNPFAMRDGMTLQVGRRMLFSRDLWKTRLQVCSDKTVLSAMECSEKITFALTRSRDKRAGTGVNNGSVGVEKCDHQKECIKRENG
jgi:hypothetical protein